MSNSPPDYFARVTAAISLVIAIAAIAIPYKQQQEQFEEVQREELSVNLNPYVSGVVRLTGNNLGPLGHVVQIPWELTVSNTGSRQLSIANYELTRGDSPGATSYSGINGGLVTRDAKPVDFPFTLEPGEMRTFLLFVGITVSDKVFNILKGLGEGENLHRKEVTHALAKEGIDLYGNNVDYKEFEGGAYVLSVDTENQRGQRFWCVVRTGRDNSFLGSATEYARPGANAP